MKFREALKSQLNNIKKSKLVGYTKEELDKTFDDFENDYLQMMKENHQIDLDSKEDIKKMWERSKKYFDGDDKLIGDKLIFFMKIDLVYPDSNMMNTPDLNLELMSLPERRISFYENKLIVLPKENKIASWYPMSRENKDVFLPVVVFKNTRAESFIKTLLES